MTSWLAFALALSLVGLELAHAQTTRTMGMTEWSAFQDLLEGAHSSHARSGSHGVAWVSAGMHGAFFDSGSLSTTLTNRYGVTVGGTGTTRLCTSSTGKDARCNTSGALTYLCGGRCDADSCVCLRLTRHLGAGSSRVRRGSFPTRGRRR
jgi:hypothetical protein